MKKMIDCAMMYVRGMNIQDLAIFKICMFSIGGIAGICLPKKHKKKSLIILATIFTCTYVALMIKFIGSCLAVKSDKS